MNILMLCTKFSLDEQSPWLTNELSDACRLAGHEVDVVHLDWEQPSNDNFIIETRSGVRVLTVAPVAIRTFGVFFEKLAKWSFSSFKAWKSIKNFTQGKKYNLIIGFSPTATVAYPLRRLLKRFNCASYLVQWDFFPYHQQQIGLINNRYIFSVAYWLENKMIRQFDHIGCMSPKNVDYLLKHYKLKEEQKIHILPIWGQGEVIVNTSPQETRKKYGLPLNKPLAIFGGQLTKGRGIETILEAATISALEGYSLGFVFVGAGPLEKIVREKMLEGNHIFFLGKIPRKDYLEIASACDIGLVCTVDGVDVPTFPSKSIDYFRTKLPILAAVENTTDYGSFIVENRLGAFCEAGNAAVLYETLRALIEKPDQMKAMGENGCQIYLDKFQIKKVLEQLFLQISNCNVETS